MVFVVAFFVLSPIVVDLAERHRSLAAACVLASCVGPLVGLQLLFFDGPRERSTAGPLTVSGRLLRVAGGLWLIAVLVMFVLLFAGVGAIGFGYLVTLAATLVVLAVGLVDLAAAAVLRLRRGREFAIISPTPRSLRWLRSASSCCVLLVVTLMLTIVTVASADQLDGAAEISSSGEPVLPGEPAVGGRDRPVAKATDLEILTGFQPVVSYGEWDGDLPTAVDEYLAEGTVTTIAPIVADVPLASLASPPVCVDAATPCLLIDQRSCRQSDACRPFELDTGAEFPALAVDERVVAYGRVLRRDRDAIPDWDESPFGSELSTLAQWWYFTPIDDWSDHFLARLGSATKRHDADWEHITIGFSDERPLFVAFSSHCGGRWRLWEDVRVFNGGYEPADVFGALLHVRAMRTEGSHGFYFDGAESQSPDMGQCEFTSIRGPVRGHLMLAGIDDHTASLGLILPRVIAGAAAQHAFDYPAVWSTGTTSEVSLAGLEVFAWDNRSMSDPNGPTSPSFKPAFQTPLRAIFCHSDAWSHENPRGRRVRANSCRG